MKHRRNTQQRPGFSIAELLVALTLFALAAFVLGRAAMDSLHTLVQPTRYESHPRLLNDGRAAVLSARDRMELEAGGELEVPILLRREDRTETEQIRLRWEAEVFPTPLLNLFAVDLRITVEDGEYRNQLMEERIYAYRPNWVDSEEQEQLLSSKEELFQELRETRGERENGNP